MKKIYFISIAFAMLIGSDFLNINTVYGAGVPECSYGVSDGYTNMGCSWKCGPNGYNTTGETWKNNNYWYCDDFSDCSASKPNRICLAPGDGVCGGSTNSCSRGSYSDRSDTDSSYRWYCGGLNGGDAVSCSTTKPSCSYISSVNTWESCSAGYEYADDVEHTTVYGGGSCPSDVDTVRSCINTVDNSNACSIWQISDIEDNTYDIADIEGQTWMTENINTRTYDNGSPIPDTYCYGDNSSNCNTYGSLYKYNSANNANICPNGWHVPTESEWDTLFENIGSSAANHETGLVYSGAGTKIKTTSRGGTNEYGFSAIGGGKYDSDGGWAYKNPNTSYWWIAASKYDSSYAKSANDSSEFSSAWIQWPRDINARMPVRCIKDDACYVPPPQCSDGIDNDGDGFVDSDGSNPDPDCDGNSNKMSESGPLGASISCIIEPSDQETFDTSDSVNFTAIPIAASGVSYSWSENGVDTGLLNGSESGVSFTKNPLPLGNYSVQVEGIMDGDSIGTVQCMLDSGDEIIVSDTPELEFNIPVNIADGDSCSAVWSIPSGADSNCKIITEFGDTEINLGTVVSPSLENYETVTAGNSYKLECTTVESAEVVTSEELLRCIDPNLLEQ